MGFLPHKSDNGAVLPWEYMAAKAGTYTVGQMLNVDINGNLAAITANLTTTPKYLCMAQGTFAEGDILPVTRVSEDWIYETVMNTGFVNTPIVGSKASVLAGGLAVNNDVAGTFEFTAIGVGSNPVWGRFV